MNKEILDEIYEELIGVREGLLNDYYVDAAFHLGKVIQFVKIEIEKIRREDETI